MTCGNLLLNNLLFFSVISFCETFEVNATQTSYQAEENENITLAFMFTTKADTSPEPIEILCELLADDEPLKVLRLYAGRELLWSQNKQFEGRVQYDEDLLREGQLILNVSRLRTRDSGRYLCTVVTSYGSNTGRCSLNVTAARHLLKPETPSTSRPPPKSGGSVSLFWALGPAGGVLLVVCFLLCTVSLSREQDQINHCPPNAEEILALDPIIPPPPNEQEYVTLALQEDDPIIPSPPNEQEYVTLALQEDDPIICTRTKGQDSPSEKSDSSGYGGGETDSQT